jgi:hypothetical protein
MSKASNFTYWFTRLAMGLAGFIILAAGIFANYYAPGTFDGWTVSRVITVLVGMNLLIVSSVLFIRPLQIWLIRSFAFRVMSPWSVIILSLSQAILFCAGLSVCIVVISADWLNIDPTPGFGKMRALQLAAGLSLLLATYLVHSKPLQRLVADCIGDYYLSHFQLIILGVTRWLLLIAGLVTILLVTMSDVLGLDSTPGWGDARTIQLFVGLSLLAASFVMQNRAMKAWFLRSYGYRMLSPLQITMMLIVRSLAVVAGLTITALVLFADVLGIDPTPGWGTTRAMQLAAGLALLLGGFILHKRSLWKWIQRSKSRKQAS